MFKHILLPTDGTADAEAAIEACLRFAREIGAAVTGLHVLPVTHLFTYEPGVTESVHQQVRNEQKDHAQRYLEHIALQAGAAGVPCTTMLVTSDYPYEAIIDTARNSGCDLIAMASHGRKGIKALLLGSETHKVLTHSAVPVMVFPHPPPGPAAAEITS